MNSALARAATAIGALTLLAGCEGVIGFDFDAVEAVPPCNLARPPAPPKIADAGGDIEVTVVVKNAAYGDGEDTEGRPNYRVQGYDLDGLCTGADGPASCTMPAWVNYPQTDGVNGRDNGVAHMFSAEIDRLGLPLVTSESLGQEVDAGTHAPNGVIRVRGYNGFHEDDQVEVDWFVALAPALQGQAAFTPKFDGTDSWPLDRDTLDPSAGELRSLYRDEAAYVSNYQLVAHFSRIQLPLANVYFEAHDVILTSQITHTASSATRLQQGMVAGLIPMATFLDVIPLTAAAITGTPLCHDSAIYPGIKNFICVADDSPLDRARGGECDAASFGIGFETAPVVLGPAAAPPALDNPCTDPPDTCSTPAR